MTTAQKLHAAALAGLLREVIKQAPQGSYLAVGNYGDSEIASSIHSACRGINPDRLRKNNPELAAIVRCANDLLNAACQYGGFIGYASRDRNGQTEPGPIVRQLMSALDHYFGNDRVIDLPRAA